MDWIVFKTNLKEPESEIAYKNLSEKNKKALDKWLAEKSITSKSEKRGSNRRRAIIKLFSFVKKDYDQLNYEDYVHVSSAISKSDTGIKQKNGDRFFIGQFLRDTFPDWAVRFKELKFLKAEQEGDKEKLSKKDLLTELEIDKLMKATSDMKKIALITTLSASACRPEEILKLCWNDIDFKQELIYLYSAKTKRKRAVPIGLAIGHLKRLKQESEAKDDDLVFPSNSGKQITIAGLNYMLHELGKKAGIKKRIWAYLFRHTRLSLLIRKLSPKVYEEVSGHSLQMGMKTYAHLSQDEVIQEMKENVFEVVELPTEKKHELENRVTELEDVLKTLLKNVKVSKTAI